MTAENLIASLIGVVALFTLTPLMSAQSTFHHYFRFRYFGGLFPPVAWFLTKRETCTALPIVARTRTGSFINLPPMQTEVGPKASFTPSAVWMAQARLPL